MDLAALFDRSRGRILTVLAGTYVLWAAAFIWKSSFPALDGQRYFCLFDDAMISMRYADNLAHGVGLVWNPGERVEGYSNFLMVLVMAAASSLFDRRGAVLAVQVFGAGVMLALAFAVMGAARRLVALEGIRASGGLEAGQTGGRGWTARLLPLLAFVAALGYYPLQYWSLMGMETGLLGLLLALSVRLALGCAPVPGAADPLPSRAVGWRLHALALCMGLAFLTRIDSAIYGLPLGLFLAWALRGPGGSWREVARRLRGPALVFAAVAGGHLAFRYAYYGHWLPNTYFLKLAGVPLEARLGDGWAFVQPFLREARWALAAALLGLLLRPRPERLLLALVGTLGLAYQVWNGGDPWDYWRMMAPGMPWLFLLGILGLRGLGGLGSLAGRRPLSRLAPAGAALLVAGTAVVLWKSSHRFREEALLREPAQYARAHKNLVDRSLALAALTDSSATLGLFWAGTPPYFADRAGVDFLGKNDPVIARRPPDLSGRIAWNRMRSVPGHNKYDLDYSIKVLLPTYAEAFRWGSQDLEPWAKDHYATAFYKGVRLHLLKDSPAVRWEKADSVVHWDAADRLRSW